MALDLSHEVPQTGTDLHFDKQLATCDLLDMKTRAYTRSLKNVSDLIFYFVNLMDLNQKGGVRSVLVSFSSKIAYRKSVTASSFFLKLGSNQVQTIRMIQKSFRDGTDSITQIKK